MIKLKSPLMTIINLSKSNLMVCNNSPREVPIAGSVVRKSGTSEPRDKASFINLLFDKDRLYNLFIDNKVAAAFELPPPRPAPIGIFLLRVILTFSFTLHCSSISLIAFNIKFESLFNLAMFDEKSNLSDLEKIKLSYKPLTG